MKSLILVLGVVGLLSAAAIAEDVPTSAVSFVVVRDYNGKPIRNAAVVMHPVDEKGKQEKGGLELKTDDQGKASLDGIPYGKLRIQVLASGFQTYGEDYDISKPETEITVKLKRPSGQYSIYDDHATDQQKDKPQN